MSNTMKLGDFNVSQNVERRTKILIVDDDSVTKRLLRQQVHILGYASAEASNGREAMELLNANPSGFDAILLDRAMPEMDGMEVVHQMQKNPQLKKIPIIMQTSSAKPDEVKEGIDAGVFYYLTKPIDAEVLKSVLKTAVIEYQQNRTRYQSLGNAQRGFDMMTTATFQFKTLEDAENLAVFLANGFPEPERVVGGLAELMVNAVEHGNLGIGYEAKAQLCQQGNWRKEIDQRLSNPNYNDRIAEVSLTRKDGGIYIVVTDQGDGFDWKNYLKINPSRAGDAHGRGIAMAHSISFDKLTYNDKGNKAVAYVADTSMLNW